MKALIPDEGHNGLVVYIFLCRRDRGFLTGLACRDLLDIGMGIGWAETDSFRSRRESDPTNLLRGRGNSLGERGDTRGPSEVLARVMTSRVFRTLHDRDRDSGFGGTHDT